MGDLEKQAGREVKAKSFYSDSDELEDVFDKRSLKAGKYLLKEKWGEYLLDISFQTYVTRKALPGYIVVPFLMLADKSKTSTVDGLNQLFLIEKDAKGRTRAVVTKTVTPKDLGQPILTAALVVEQVNLIIDKAELEFGPTFSELVTMAAG